MSVNQVYIGTSKSDSDIHLYPGKNLFTGISYFESEFGNADSLEVDMLNLASGIYAADLAVARNQREDFIRSIQLTIEVVNIHAFQRIKDLLISALLNLTRDNWELNFIEKKGKPVSVFGWKDNEGAVLLFSGGIDSMCAASDFLSKNKDLVLVSHNTHANKVVEKSQKNVQAALQEYYNLAIRHIHIKVYARKSKDYDFPEPKQRENTQRTRSFLFLSLAALVTRRCGFNKILYMAENGQFAIHLPLNSARVGPFSTQTADPSFVAKTQKIFQILLSNPSFEIKNPFLLKTKAEVVSLLPKPLHKEIQKSISCWMISHVPGEKHCGVCIPCISRRIALEYNGIKLDEYHEDIFTKDINSLADEDAGRKNLTDYLEFITRFKKVDSQNRLELICSFPELINPEFDSEDALQLYERVSNQSLKVFRNYPMVLKLLK